MEKEFYCRESKAGKKDGKATIQVAVSINGVRRFHSLPLRYNPEEFKKLKESKRSNPLKDYLNAVSTNLDMAVMELTKHGLPITHATIKDYLRNGSIRSYTIRRLFDDYLNIIEGRKDIKEQSKNKYRIIRNDFFAFLGDRIDDEANSMTQATILRFRNWLMESNGEGTLSRKMTTLKSIMIHGKENGYLAANPFYGIKISKPKPNIQYLTEEEIMRIRNTDFGCDRLNRVRDMFVIQAATGLSYSDLGQLRWGDIRDLNGEMVIIKNRVKTGVEYTSVVLPFGRDLIEKWLNPKNYNIKAVSRFKNVKDNQSINQGRNQSINQANMDNVHEFNPSLPVLVNQNYNAYLKEIQAVTKITSSKTLTTHLARRTYATWLINKGLRMEIAAKCLGHTNAKTTATHYAKIMTETVVNEVKEIISKMA